MTIDSKALEAAVRAYCEALSQNYVGIGPILAGRRGDAVAAAIRAYLAATSPSSLADANHKIGDTGTTAEGWQDIASAPTNQAVQIFCPGLDYYGNNGVYAGMLVDMGTGRRWMTFGWAMGRDLGLEGQPTHWRPLPGPPRAMTSPEPLKGGV